MKFASEENFLGLDSQLARFCSVNSFFVDASHFVMGAFLGWVWCFQRIFIKSASGRKRFNVLGALNAITHEIFIVTNETYINAESIYELLRELAAQKLGIHPTIFLTHKKMGKLGMII